VGWSALCCKLYCLIYVFIYLLTPFYDYVLNPSGVCVTIVILQNKTYAKRYKAYSASSYITLIYNVL